MPSPVHAGLRKRECRFPAVECDEFPKLRGFHKPQRDHIAHPMPPRPSQHNYPSPEEGNRGR